ncbi:MAG: hypothetical protein WD942_08445, partial [Dehalococcoidia bacterium]
RQDGESARKRHSRRAAPIAYSDPVLLPLLSTDTITLLLTGGEFRRVDKTKQVADVEASWDALDVCVSHTSADSNCSRCEKCVRTLATLDIYGVVDRYCEAFDLNLYERCRSGYLAQVLIARDPLVVELRDAAREQGFRWPLSARLRIPVAAARTAVGGARSILRRVVKTLPDPVVAPLARQYRER